MTTSKTQCPIAREMDSKIYQEEILDHYKHPRNRKKIEAPHFSLGHHNPSCGDRIVIEGVIDDIRISDLGFIGSGCVISQAAASMLMEYCIGKTIDQVLALTKDDLIRMLGIQLGPTRLKCALLCLEVLHQGLLAYSSRKTA
jgi:nitrogen fixation protein NifU and related proteins